MDVNLKMTSYVGGLKTSSEHQSAEIGIKDVEMSYKSASKNETPVSHRRTEVLRYMGRDLLRYVGTEFLWEGGRGIHG